MSETSAGTSREGTHHLVTIASAVVAVRRREVEDVRPVLLEERALLLEVARVATGGEDDRTVGLLRLAVVLVLDADNLASLLDELGHACLLLDRHSVGNGLCQILEPLHLSIRDPEREENGRRVSGGASGTRSEDGEARG